jgi:hypothetical protein
VPGNTLQRNSARSLPVFLEMNFHQALKNSLCLCSSGKIGICNNPHKCWLYHGSPLLIQLVKRVLAVNHFSSELLFYISCSVFQTTQVLHFNSQKVLGMDITQWECPTALLRGVIQNQLLLTIIVLGGARKNQCWSGIPW